jgi:hypothetical protein
VIADAAELVNPPLCQVCGGLLALSQHGGYLHSDDDDDTHQPVLAPGRHRAR